MEKIFDKPILEQMYLFSKKHSWGYYRQRYLEKSTRSNQL